MTEIEAAYCAGLYEGEGTISTSQYKSGLSRISLQIAMTDREPLERFLTYTGIGKIYLNSTRGTHKPVWCYLCTGIERVQPIIDSISPWLSPRRLDQIEKEVSWYHYNDIPERRGLENNKHNAKLTVNEVKEIKKLLKIETHEKIANKFNVRRETISRIAQRKTWKEVK